MIAARRRGNGARARGVLRRLAVALTALLLSLAVLSGTTRARSRYFYCEAMGLMESDPCAAPADSDETEDVAPSTEAREGHTDCCEIITLSPMPAGTTTAALDVPPPGLTALLPAAILRAGLFTIPRTQANRSSERWRVPPRYAGELRTQLMVFLT